MRTAFCLLLAATLLAQVPGPDDPSIDFYDSMSDYFRTSRRAVSAIQEKGIPVEEIPAVLMIARRSSASPNQVIDARKSGKSFAEIAAENKVKLGGSDFVAEANTVFLTEYHGKTAAEVRALRDKGMNFVEINREFRRSAKPAKTPSGK
jgi:hypothetical protein